MQESIERELTAEVQRLSATVARQQEVLDKWRPIVMEHLYSSESRRRIGGVRFEDDIEDLMGEIEDEPYRSPNAASKLDPLLTQSPYSANTSNSYDISPHGAEWMKVSSPTTPRESPGFNSDTPARAASRDDRERSSHWVNSHVHSSNSAGHSGYIPEKNRSFPVEDLSGSDNSSRDPAQTSSGRARNAPGSMTSSRTDHSLKMPFREILSLFSDPSFDSDRSTASATRGEIGAGYKTDFLECDQVQAELMSEVQHILQHSPYCTKSGGGLSSSTGVSSYDNTNRFARSYASA